MSYFTEQTYIVLKPLEETLDREVLFVSGGFGACGTVDVGACQSLADMPKVLSQLQKWSTPPQQLGDPQPLLEPLGDMGNVPPTNIFFKPYGLLNEDVRNIVSELPQEWVHTAVLQYITEQYRQENCSALSMSSATRDVDEQAFFFEVKLATNCTQDMAQVECIAVKVFAQTILLTMLYFRGTYYVTMTDVAHTEQLLLDSWFPNLSSSLNHTVLVPPSPIQHSQVKQIQLHVLPTDWRYSSRGTLECSESHFGNSGGGMEQWNTDHDDYPALPDQDTEDLLLDAAILAATEAAMKELNVKQLASQTTQSTNLRSNSSLNANLRPRHVPPLSSSSSTISREHFGNALPLPPTPMRVPPAPWSPEAGETEAGRDAPPSPPPPLPRYL